MDLHFNKHRPMNKLTVKTNFLTNFTISKEAKKKALNRRRVDISSLSR